MGLLDAVKGVFRGARKPAEPEPTAVTEPKEEPQGVPVVAESSAPEPLETREYVVQAGDLLREIAASHGVPLAEVVALNDINPDLIRPGQVVLIPTRPTGD